MDFADEHYVKLFTRDTVTWKLWPWEAKCLLPLLERKVDPTGFIDCAGAEPADAVRALVEIPIEVVAPGLAAMIKTGTVEVVGEQILLVNFVSAQESRKTDKTKAKDYRERKKAKARADKPSQVERHTSSPSVTERHQPSPSVTPTNPPALLCSSSALLEIPAPRKSAPRAPEKPPPDPRHAPLLKSLCDAYERRHGIPYPFEKRDAKRVQHLLSRKPGSHATELWPVTLLAAWERALVSQYPGCATFEDFDKQLPKHLGTGPPAADNPNRVRPHKPGQLAWPEGPPR